MTMINTTNTFAAAAFGVFALSMLSFGGSAEAASVLNCKGASISKVVSCCEKVIEEKGRRPLWMLQAKMNCHEAIQCFGRQCYYKIAYSRDGGNEKHSSPRGSGLK